MQVQTYQEMKQYHAIQQSWGIELANMSSSGFHTVDMVFRLIHIMDIHTVDSLSKSESPFKI